MSFKDGKTSPSFDTSNEDDRDLVALGYKPSFKREFTNLATVCTTRNFVLSRRNDCSLPCR